MSNRTFSIYDIRSEFKLVLSDVDVCGSYLFILDPKELRMLNNLDWWYIFYDTEKEDMESI